MTQIKNILTKSKNIAVVGMSDKPHRSSYEVGHYLKDQGYTVFPINPRIEASGDLKAYASLAEVPEAIDIVNIFRKPKDVPPIAEAATAINAKVIWMQLEIRHEDAAQKAKEAGLQVVMDKCIMIEHRALI